MSIGEVLTECCHHASTSPGCSVEVGSSITPDMLHACPVDVSAQDWVWPNTQLLTPDSSIIVSQLCLCDTSKDGGHDIRLDWMSTTDNGSWKPFA